MTQLRRLKVNVTIILEFRVYFLSPLFLKGFKLNFGQMFFLGQGHNKVASVNCDSWNFQILLL